MRLSIARVLIPVCLSIGLVATIGCTSISDSARSASEGFKNATAPVRQSLRWATASDHKTPPVILWDWTLGIPVEAPRAELLAATVPGEVIAKVLPQLSGGNVQLVSLPSPLAGFEIKNIDGTVVDHCGDLHNALEQIPESAATVQVDLAPVGSAEGNETALRVDQPTLWALSQATAGDSAAMRVSEGGNPMLVIRDGGVRSHVVVRIERQRGLVQLVMKSANCWQDDTLLPLEVGVQAGGKPLQCLTVADTLELLYGQGDGDFGDGSPSFAETSEREDYLLPVNYKRLSQRHDAGGLTTQSPALASLTGMRYPGQAVLGDARALTGIMMQRELLKRGESSGTGWLLFASDEVRTADQIDVSIDLGSGPKTYRFMIPSAQ